MIKNINIFSNSNEKSKEIHNLVKKELNKHNINVSNDITKDSDYNIVIGGDGTFIKAVHDSKFTSTPFIGINTGHLGFYNDVDKFSAIDSINKVLNKNYNLLNLRILECIVNTNCGNFKFKSLNEIVLKAKYASVIHFDLYVNDVLLQTFAGDGIIFSTPSGSTAYNLSAGGAILYQNIDAFQITPLAPIKSSLHKSLDKSLVVPKDTKIKLITQRREESHLSLSVDGLQQEITEINYIDIKLSDDTIQKVVLDKEWFLKNIKYKFI